MINSIIIDDDSTVIACIREYISQIPFLNLCGAYQCPMEGLESLEDSNIRLVFMDIGMPGISGIDLTRLLNERFGLAAPRIIFISGFDRYALDGYRLDALDYLLKPISFEQFAKSVYKARTYFERLTESPVAGPPNYQPHDYIFLRVEQELVKVYLKDILYIESAKDYIKVFLLTEGQVITALSTLTNIAEKLPVTAFMRVHRSFIVSLDKISSILHQTIKIGKITIPVSDQYRQTFREFSRRWI